MGLKFSLSKIVRIACFTLLYIILYSYLKQSWFSTKPTPTSIYTFNSKEFPQDSSLTSELVILRYTRYYGHDYSPERVLHFEKDCSYMKRLRKSPVRQEQEFDLPCRITSDRSYINKSDVLVFHSTDLEPGKDSLPEIRDLSIPWVYMNQESPSRSALDLNQFQETFNWTMTYRRDSDVFHPYGYFVSEPSPVTANPNKTKLVAWIVSNCNTLSKREYFVNELKKYIPVDVFGRCWNRCPTVASQCYSYVAHTYKFYLSFENSLCLDYITEKFYTPLKIGAIVPIVYGGASSDDYGRLAPNGSYIDARRFNSPRELADYLHHLDNNDDEYEEYFAWRKHFKVVVPQNWCNLCQRVYEYKVAKGEPGKTYDDIWSWWNLQPQLGQPACVEPPDNLVGYKLEFWRKGKLGEMANWIRQRLPGHSNT